MDLDDLCDDMAEVALRADLLIKKLTCNTALCAAQADLMGDEILNLLKNIDMKSKRVCGLAPHNADRPFRLLALPAELQLQIFEELDPITSTCLGLTCKKFYSIHKEMHGPVALSARQEATDGSPNLILEHQIRELKPPGCYYFPSGEKPRWVSKESYQTLVKTYYPADWLNSMDDWKRKDWQLYSPWDDRADASLQRIEPLPVFNGVDPESSDSLEAVCEPNEVMLEQDEDDESMTRSPGEENGYSPRSHGQS